MPLAPVWDSAAAFKVMRLAHHGITDKGGAPLENHPRRVLVNLMKSALYYDLGEEDRLISAQVAILHDVLEDSRAFTPDTLELLGCPQYTIVRVCMLSRNLNSKADYYPRIKSDAIARAVKAADIEDNLDPNRLRLLDDETQARLIRKYAKARKELGL